MNKRQKTNFQILDSLIIYFKNNPDIRFFQGLQNLGLQKSIVEVEGQFANSQIILDNWYEESEETWDKLKDRKMH